MSAERGRVAAKCGPGEVVLDLCCGVGAFALLCARLDLAISCHISFQEQLLFGADLPKLPMLSSFHLLLVNLCQLQRYC